MPRVAVLCIICIILYHVLSGIMYFDTLRQPPRTALGATLAGAKASARSRTHTKGCLYTPLAKSRAHVAPGQDT